MEMSITSRSRDSGAPRSLSRLLPRYKAASLITPYVRGEFTVTSPENVHADTHEHVFRSVLTNPVTQKSNDLPPPSAL